MFKSLTQKVHDAQLLAKLCATAEEIARAAGRPKPGSEHFVLAALDLPDGTALAAFNRLSVSRARFIQALEMQRESALEAVGVAVAPSAKITPAAELLAPKTKAYEAEASGKTLIQRLANLAPMRKGRSLLSADVLLAAAQESHSSPGRAFRELGITSMQLVGAATGAIQQRVTGG